MKKCLFTKSTDNLNTVVTITTDIGPVTVYLSDEVLDKTLKQVSDELNKLIVSAKELADTFGFDLMEAINKGGMMSVGEQQPTVQQPVYQAPQQSFREVPEPTKQPVRQRSQSSPTVLRNQEIPIKNSMQAALSRKNINQPALRHQSRPTQDQIVNDEVNYSGSVYDSNVDVDNPYGASAISEGASKPLISPIVDNKQQIVQRVQTPTGRVFDIPALISDANGTTEIVINTKNSSAAFEKKMKLVDEASKAGRVVSTNGYNEIVCAFCNGHKKINGKPCPKCNGEGTIIV